MAPCTSTWCRTSFSATATSTWSANASSHPLWHYGPGKKEEVGERRKRRSRTTGSYEKREDHGSGFINVFDLQGILCEIGGHWQLHLLHSCRCAQAQVCRRFRTSSSRSTRSTTRCVSRIGCHRGRTVPTTTSTTSLAGFSTTST